MSPTGVDTGSIVSSRRRSSRFGAVIGPNLSEPRPNIFNRSQGSDNLFQVASTLVARRWGYAQLYQQTSRSHKLSPTAAATQWIIVNSTPGLSNLAPWTLQSRLKYWLLMVIWHARRRLSPSLWSVDWFLSFLCLCDLRTPFNAKISATRCSYRLMLIPRLTLSINPRSNCLNTTAFSYYPQALPTLSPMTHPSLLPTLCQSNISAQMFTYHHKCCIASLTHETCSFHHTIPWWSSQGNFR